ncbi:MAG TPA: FAD binding domain-containing protein [Lacipirellulaceae bacterium]|jgi:xanthine dehydrogenase small subunit
MRDHLILAINGRRHQIGAGDCFRSLSDFLRLRLGLVGTKIVCSEGDCGSCTVLIGRRVDNRLEYRSVDSCIQWMFQLDGTHIVTVEGLSRDGRLTPVQKSMIECHGSQCGFCTPGFVVAMTGLLEQRKVLSDEDLRHGLTGNLCRCTGYVPIVDAGLALDVDAVQCVNDVYPPTAILSDLVDLSNESIAVESNSGGRRRQFFGPASLAEALAILRDHPQAKVVAGATDVGVQLNKGVIDPDVFVDLNRVAELTGVAVEFGDEHDVLIAGARATWTEIEEVCHAAAPEFEKIVSIFGSPQIRHVGTIGGNIINASPIADSLPFLFVAEAELELASAAGSRTVPITEFYQGYKKFDLRLGELLTRVRVPLPCPTDLFRLFKVSRRRDLDISTFTAAILMRLEDDTIAEARIAYGAVGPTVIRARKTEAFLIGKVFAESTMHAAGSVAIGEITPISDVRGSADYRFQLTRNVLLKFYHEQALAAV